MIGKVLFVLPAGGYSGGANSVVQEVSGLLSMGLQASIAVDAENGPSFVSCYAAIPGISASTRVYETLHDLRSFISDFDVVVLTVATSVPAIMKMMDGLSKKKRPRVFYYIQDYEPLFFEKGSENWHNARRSYEYGEKIQGFAKTDWVRETVRNMHNMGARKINASIDHSVFFPALVSQTRKRVSVTAMIRPHTPRRAPRRTSRILCRVAEAFGDSVSVSSFGSSPDELRRSGLTVLPTHHGRLTREQVAQVLRQTDLFLDLSDYQAFGRTGLEAMACGAVSLMPILGGSGEFIRHGENGFLLDVREEAEIMATIGRFVAMPAAERMSMRLAALETAADFSIRKACVSILNVLVDR